MNRNSDRAKEEVDLMRFTGLPTGFVSLKPEALFSRPVDPSPVLDLHSAGYALRHGSPNGLAE